MASFEAAIRDMIRDEVARAVAPIQNVVDRLAPLARAFGAAPRSTTTRRNGVGGTRRVRGSQNRPCALIDCGRPARSKGYCAAHYQKYRNLARTNRLPPDWKENAEPGTVQDVVLPRGRAAAKLKAAAKK